MTTTLNIEDHTIEEGFMVLEKYMTNRRLLADIYHRLYEFKNEIRSQIKYDSPAPIWADEKYVEYIYRRLHEIIGDEELIEATFI